LDKRGDILGIDIEWRDLRTWMLLGRIAMRNCVLHNPKGYVRNLPLLTVRSLTAGLAMWRFAFSNGADMEIRDLTVDGVDVAIAEGGLGAGGKLNVKAVLEHLKGRDQKSKKSKCFVRKVVIKNIALIEAGGRRTDVADIEYGDFSTEMNVGTVDEVMAALLELLANRTLL